MTKRRRPGIVIDGIPPRQSRPEGQKSVTDKVPPSQPRPQIEMDAMKPRPGRCPTCGR